LSSLLHRVHFRLFFSLTEEEEELCATHSHSCQLASRFPNSLKKSVLDFNLGKAIVQCDLVNIFVREARTCTQKA
jgi:hypothetical protein